MPKAKDDTSPITFVIPGQEIGGAATRGGESGSSPLPPMGLRGTVKVSVRVGQRRAMGTPLRVEAVPGEDVVVLHIANGPSLILHPATARDLMKAQDEAPRGSTRDARGHEQQEPAPAEVEVPAQLRWNGLEKSAVATRGATRGFLGNVLLSAFEVVGLEDKLQDVATDKLVALIDGQVVEGVYALRPEALARLKEQRPVEQMTQATGDRPTLVFVHGTFSETAGGFGKLWQDHPQRVRALFDHYEQRVYALDHATLGKSPIENATTLVRACPAGARLHLVTHSRGGLVAEVLARAAGLAQLDAAAGELFSVDELPDDLAEGLSDGDRADAQRALDAQKRMLAELVEQLRDRKVVVERIVRVACPARGTLLAGKRLDAYMSVFKWGLEVAQIPVLPELVDFIGGVAQRRADPAKIPGLAAMIPDGPLVRWLHAADQPVPGELRVVAGDLEGDSVGSWLKTLMADAFFWTDNDLVVQTSSMYGGVPRATGATFVLDQGGKVTHFNYFGNERTAEAVVNGLTQEAPTGWRRIGPLSYAGESAGGVRAAMRRGPDDGKPASEKPAVFLLPGILGSHIKVDGNRIWLGFRLINGLMKLEYPEPQGRRVEPDGPIGKSYDDLMDFLAKTHEVIEFSFDWRRPIEQEAQRLGQAVAAAMAARGKSGQPVRIVAHSMGGLLARTMQLECPEIWDRMMARPGARLLMLGTPNGGSWAPMQVLSGDDTFGNTLVAFGAPFQNQKARQLMAQFPGFIQLQAALVDDARALEKQETWEKLATDDLAQLNAHNWWHHDERQRNVYKWGVPGQKVLDAAVALRERLDVQRDKDLPRFKDQIAMVIGHAKFTPDGYEIGEDGLVYLNAAEAGDGRVTLASALLPGVRAWWLDCEHGSLPDESDAFEAYLDLLVRGTTTRLPMQAEIGATRGGAAASVVAHMRSRPARERVVPRPPLAPDETKLLAFEPDTGPTPVRGSALRITMLNADLKFVRHPLMVGHYTANALTGTERVVDKLIGGTMRDSLALGQYPNQPGAHQLFANIGINRDNPLQLPRPESVLVVGLGQEGKLKADELAYTVKHGVLALAQRRVEQPAGTPLQFELAATLLGSGGAGISAGQAAQLIAQGVREANESIRELNERFADHPERCWPLVGHVHMVELYLDRASEAWRALQVQAQSAPGHFQLSEVVEAGSGALRRPLDGGYRGSDYDYIRAISADGEVGDAAIEYTLDTKRARAEVRAQSTQARLVRELVAKASNDQNRDTQIGRTLFQLLVPVEMEPFMGSSTEMLLELDRGTAGIPWEMLDTASGTRGGGDSRPWAVRVKLLRKLRISNYRQQVADANPEARVLVIGEPRADPEMYPRLAGARNEAKAVRDQLMRPEALGPECVTGLISPDNTALPGPEAREVINALMAHEWRIVHIAGHGEPPAKIGPEPKKEGDPPQKDGDPRGVVLSNGTFLGPREIHNMRVVPELVFVNCCHLGARNIGELLVADKRPAYDRASFASTVAEELIKIGVRCVVAAGWAVEDEPAKVFATTFYAALLRGARFIDAVAQAREAALAFGGNTWAAYQCYGDPDWTFRRKGADAQQPTPSLADEFASVISPSALTLALETLVIRSQFQGALAESQRAKIRHLEARFAPQWGGMGAVADAFGLAWDEVGDRASAVRWYERAIAANDGSASLKASEQLGNVRVKLAWQEVDEACSALRALQAPRDAKGAKAVKGLPERIKAAEARRASVIRSAREMLDEAIKLLTKLVDLQPTMERRGLLGSAYKRLAMVEREDGHVAAETAALKQMLAHYEAAEKDGRRAGVADPYYPALNRLAAECALAGGRPDRAKLDPALVAMIRQNLADRTRNAPDFRSVIGLVDLQLYEAVAGGTLSKSQTMIRAQYDDLNTRVHGSSNWGSVLDQLRFVLDGTVRHGAPAERKAAEALIKQVQGFVNRR